MVVCWHLVLPSCAGSHHLFELVEVDAAVAVGIDGADHLGAVGDGAFVPELAQHAVELPHGDEPVAVGVVHAERLPELRLRRRRRRAVLVLLASAVEGDKLGEVDKAVAVGVHLLHHAAHLPGPRRRAQRAQHGRQLLRRDLAVAVRVVLPEHLLHLRRRYPDPHARGRLLPARHVVF
jgi:hypothetical protein